MPDTDDDVEIALRQALDTNRTFDGLSRRYSTLEVVAEDPETATAHVDLVARLLNRELQASKAATTEALDILLEQLATTPWKTGPFGECRRTPRIEAARDLLDGLLDRIPAAVAADLDSGSLPEYLRHDRELVRRSAASVLAVLVVHADISHDIVDCRGALQTCLRDPSSIKQCDWHYSNCTLWTHYRQR